MVLGTDVAVVGERRALAEGQAEEVAVAWEALPEPPHEFVTMIANEYRYLEPTEVMYVAKAFFNRKHLDPDYDDELIEAVAMSCQRLTQRSPPDHVGLVKPVDIAAMGAIGDSFTVASNALSTTWLNMNWFPGLSWSMGADEGTMSAYNMMRATGRPDVVGGSVGVGDVGANMHCNQAIAGSTVQDMPNQTYALIEAFKTQLNETGYATEWKTVTVFIGGNNLCQYCKKPGPNSPQVYEAGLRAAFDVLATIPRVIVSIVPIFDGTQLREFMGPFCHLVLDKLCPCFISSDDGVLEQSRHNIATFNGIMEDIVAEYNNQTGSDWAAVFQSYLAGLRVPHGEAGKEWLSRADCFHPSGHRGQPMIGMGMWNSMISPVGAKPTLTPETTLKCPTDDDYLFTPKTLPSKIVTSKGKAAP
ncbi:uncharacterized protein AMSG_06582 [Thecamonas trahens ATCC 50062]|uniref:Phospholipase B1, membrane-associated n=1 Tax=Thecamonas trahens ATCC 50062 TaxID=461836 RepID=A0A0L0DFY9_THETB|nr:hypothetical protein AMSG_06582 [Thecamonas trahens ATCC 50062]KNC51224.1 hypothetical protein AMSG_06582 [Thecamonas trahens ATCC 50062]|eukprot:XP_013756421.1 hypothetical protein AMSG_06582 [Thecamonas trahens ATCC 50062]